MTLSVVSFYTRNTPYEELVPIFKQFCLNAGISPYVREYENQGSWVLNCGLKPQFIMDCLNEFNTNILYVDIDAEIKRVVEEELEIGDHSIGCHYYRNGTELLSGTLFFRNNEISRRILSLWIEEQEASTNTWDQKTLQKVLRDNPVKIKDIGQRYVHIFDSRVSCPDPRIIHNQASRKLRRKIQRREIMIPQSIGGMRIRELPDGSLAITRKHKEAEAYLDEHYDRYTKNDLRWFPKPVVKGDLTLESVKHWFKGKKVHLVGKGPSLDKLTREDFEEGPIIAINHAIKKIDELFPEADSKHPVFVIQQDARLRDLCMPKHGIAFISEMCKHWYASHKRTIQISIKELAKRPAEITVVVAINLIKKLEGRELKLMCFDAAVTGDTDYAEIVGEPATIGGPPARFKGHKIKILAAARGWEIEWFIPEKGEVSVSKETDTPSFLSQLENKWSND